MSVTSVAGGASRRPQLLAATEEEAITIVNRWLHREVGMALNVESATFDPDIFCWHLPIHLAYGMTGSQGIVGDVYLLPPPARFTALHPLKNCAAAPMRSPPLTR